LFYLFKYGEKENPWEKLEQSRVKNIKKELSERVIGQEEAIALGIRNLLENSSDVSIFSYNVVVAESTCGDENVLDWISNGKSEDNIPISFGDIYATKIHILIPKKAPPCTVRYHIEIKNEIDGIYQEYDNILFTVTSKAR